jgi:predicted GNAT family N-acyltransferase
MAKSLTLRQFDIAEANWDFQENQLSAPRRRVFILEQGTPTEEEFDGADAEAWHWLATDPDTFPIGTGRLMPNGQIGRMAVIKEFRGLGIGAAILEAAIAKATRQGMQQVFVHAQTHATSFYEKFGFLITGGEFKEVDIPHVKMVLNFAETASPNSTERSTESLSIKQFDTREAYWEDDAPELIRLRHEVFTKGQNVPEDIEQDGRDSTACHWIARDLSGMAIGTGRLLPDGHIGRMAVLEKYRDQGIGFTILELAVEKARYLGFREVVLHAQSYAQAFYERAQFCVRGDEFMEAGIPHIEMFRELEQLDVHAARNMSFLESIGSDTYQGDGAEPGYVLGKINRSLLLRSDSEFRDVSCDLADQARLSLKIWSPVLEHGLYDNPEFSNAVSRLARRNRRTEVQILIYDSHRMVKNGHAILELARRLSSSISIRIVHQDYRLLNHEYLLADQSGIVYRLDYEVFDGYTNYHDITEASRLSREFVRAWESGLYDPNLRQLKI